MTRKCLEEMKERATKGKKISCWEEKRRAFFENRRRKEELTEGGVAKGKRFARLEQKDLENQRREKWGRINEFF